MEEKCLRVILNLYVNPYSTGKEIAQNTGLSEPDVSKLLNMLKKKNTIDNKSCQPQKDKNYSGKCWFIVDRFATLETAVGVLCAQKQNIIKKIEDLMDQYSVLDSCGTESNRSFFAFADILYVICPPCIDPGKMNEAMLCHSNIFELERVYYETKIAPYENAIKSAKIQKERDMAKKKKEAEDVRILSSVFAPSIVDRPKQFEDYTEKDEEWVNFLLKVRIAAHTSDTPP